MGIANSDVCVICGTSPETQDHLFGSCEFTVKCFTNIMQWLAIPYRIVGVTALCEWVRCRLKSSKWRRGVIFAVVVDTVYLIWQERNNAYWNHIVYSVDKTVKRIKSLVKHRSIHTIGKKSP